MERIVGINVTRMKMCRGESTKCIYMYIEIFSEGVIWLKKREWGRETISLVVEVTIGEKLLIYNTGLE